MSAHLVSGPPISSRSLVNQRNWSACCTNPRAAGGGRFVEESTAPVFAVESAPCQDAPGLGKKEADLRAGLDEAVWVNTLADDDLIERLDVGQDRRKSWLIGVGSIHALELVLRIGPRESPLRFDRQPVIAEAGKIERLGHAGGLPAQQQPRQAERLRDRADCLSRRSTSRSPRLRRSHAADCSRCVDHRDRCASVSGGRRKRGTGRLAAELNADGQAVSSIGQRHGEFAVRVRVNDGAETGPAGNENRRAGHGAAVGSAESPLNSAAGKLRQQDSRNNARAVSRATGRRTAGDRRYCRSTMNRLTEYPSAPPMKTSDKKWADRESLENPTSAAMPYAEYGTQR